MLFIIINSPGSVDCLCVQTLFLPRARFPRPRQTYRFDWWVFPVFPQKTQKAAPEIRGFQTVEKANTFSTKGMRLDCAQAFRAKREKLTLAQRAVCFRSAKPPDNMDFHFISPCGAKLCEAFRHTESSPGNPGLLALLSECAVFRYRLRCRCRTRRQAAPRPLWSSLRLPRGQTARCTHPGPAPRGSRGC